MCGFRLPLTPIARVVRRVGAIMTDVRPAAAGQSLLASVVAVSIGLLPMCGLVCAFPVDGAVAGPRQVEVPETTECPAHAGSGPKDASNQGTLPHPCRQSHESRVETSSLTTKASDGAVPVVVGRSFAPQLAHAHTVTPPPIVSTPPRLSPLATTLQYLGQRTSAAVVR